MGTTQPAGPETQSSLSFFWDGYNPACMGYTGPSPSQWPSGHCFFTRRLAWTAHKKIVIKMQRGGKTQGGLAGCCYFLLLCFPLVLPLVFFLSALFFYFIGSFLFSDLSLSLSLLCLLCFFFCVTCVCSFFPPGFLVLSLCFLSSFVLCVIPPPWSSFFFFCVRSLVLWFFLLVLLLPCVMSSCSFSVFCSFSFPYPLVFSLFFRSVSWNFLCLRLSPAFSLLSPRFYPSPLVAFLWLI